MQAAPSVPYIRSNKRSLEPTFWARNFFSPKMNVSKFANYFDVAMIDILNLRV